MSVTSITTRYNQLCPNSPDSPHKSSFCTENDNSQIFELSSNLREEETHPEEEEDPSRVNYFDTDIEPTTSTISGSDQYGEPLSKIQDITIDFTPVDGVDDNEILFKKCNDFWEFIMKNPKLEKLCAMPIPTYSSVGVEKEEEKSTEPFKEGSLHGFHFMRNNDNILKATFMTKPVKVCESLPGDYSLGSKATTTQRRGKATDKNLLKTSESLVTRRGFKDNTERIIEGFRAPDPAAVEVFKLCQEMEEWDMTHPKDKRSPRRTPSLIHAVLQRKP